MTVLYELPANWIAYDPRAIVEELTNAKAAVLSLMSMPFQRAWAEKLQEMELKREVAGTSKIEGADFTEQELEEAISDKAQEELLTRSQKQARAAIGTYRWIAGLPHDRPVDLNLVREIHSRIVTGCDDDHCSPGLLRGNGQNVTFGRPRHRGVEGGHECEKALQKLIDAFNGEYRAHDKLVQALALHYHFGAMHPFHDGNGRTARALEAFLLQRAQLKDTLFIAMSNYYYDEKNAYLSALTEVRKRNHDLTTFIKFGLTGIATQCNRLLREIRTQVQKALFRDVMGRMYQRLKSTRKRALALRQCEILNCLLDIDQPIEHRELFIRLDRHYAKLAAPFMGFIRDLNGLTILKATSVASMGDGRYMVSIRLDWATEVTETEFYRQMNKMPEAKTRLVVATF